MDQDTQPEPEWTCPYCGEPYGEPRTIYSREYQGESPHGGMVEFEDQRCSLCYHSGEPEWEPEYEDEPEFERDRRF